MGISYRRILTADLVSGPDCSSGRGCIVSPSPSSTGDRPGSPSRHFSNLCIASGCLIAATAFLALTYYAVFRHRRRRRRPPASPLSGSDDFVDEDGDHHAWHIRTVGLDEATIGSMVVCEYRAGEALVGAADCSVCLGEFRDGELVRLLPKCDHAFHIDCIDTWLRSHVNCPLCRADIVTPMASPAPSTINAIEGDSGSSDVRDISPTSIQPLVVHSGALEGEEDDDGLESGNVVVSDSSVATTSPLSRVLSDVEVDGSLGLGRRSVSMFSLPQSEESFCEEGKQTSSGGEQSSKASGKQGNSSKEMEKSLSGSGRGFFSRNGRSRSLVLPL